MAEAENFRMLANLYNPVHDQPMHATISFALNRTARTARTVCGAGTVALFAAEGRVSSSRTISIIRIIKGR